MLGAAQVAEQVLGHAEVEPVDHRDAHGGLQIARKHEQIDETPSGSDEDDEDEETDGDDADEEADDDTEEEASDEDKAEASVE